MKAQPLQARPFEDGENAMRMNGGEGLQGEEINGFREGIMNGVMTSADHGNGGLLQVNRTSELTVAFEGEVYVFPAVTPEKVWGSLSHDRVLFGRVMFLARKNG